MIEGRDEHLVLAQQQIADEPVERIARIDDRLPTHAVAGIEQHAETDRHALVIGDRTRPSLGTRTIGNSSDAPSAPR